MQGKFVFSVDSYKKGIDIIGIQGQMVVVVVVGKVMYVGYGICGYGNMVIIKYMLQLLLVYVYNVMIMVKEGQMVMCGQQIVIMGNSDINKVKLYFEICCNGKLVNVMVLLLVW